MPDSRFGVPDGSAAPSFVVDHRAVYSISPDGSGNITFALLPGMYGAICLNKGQLTTTIPKYIDGAALTVNPVSATVIGNNEWPQVPYPVTPQVFGSKNYGPYGATAFRLITSVADVVFTGSDMYNNGSVLVTRATVKPVFTGRSVTYGTTRSADAWEVSIPNPDLIRPDSQTASIRDRLTLRSLPSDYEYQSTLTDAIYSDGTGALLYNPVAQLATATTQTQGATPGVYHDCGATFYRATGLHSSATIQVSVRTCIQYQVDMTNSAMQPFLGPSPPANPSIIRAVQNASRSLPVAEIWSGIKQAGQIGGALFSAYSTKSLAPLLALGNTMA